MNATEVLLNRVYLHKNVNIHFDYLLFNRSYLIKIKL